VTTEPKGKIRHCPYCGDDMGFVLDRNHDRRDPCGKPECNRECADTYAQEREEAHEQLDRDMGW